MDIYMVMTLNIAVCAFYTSVVTQLTFIQQGNIY